MRHLNSATIGPRNHQRLVLLNSLNVLLEIVLCTDGFVMDILTVPMEKMKVNSVEPTEILVLLKKDISHVEIPLIINASPMNLSVMESLSALTK